MGLAYQNKAEEKEFRTCWFDAEMTHRSVVLLTLTIAIFPEGVNLCEKP